MSARKLVSLLADFVLVGRTVLPLWDQELPAVCKRFGQTKLVLVSELLDEFPECVALGVACEMWSQRLDRI